MEATETQAAKDTIVRAWKDEEFRQSLSADVREAIPARPEASGGGALSDAELEAAAGGITPGTLAIGAFVGKAAVGGAAGAATKWGLDQAFPEN